MDRYQSERYPIPDAGPVDVLWFLLDSNGLNQRDIAPELGSEATVSRVFSGKRQLNRDHIARLSRRFQVSPAVFFPSTAAAQVQVKSEGSGKFRKKPKLA